MSKVTILEAQLDDCETVASLVLQLLIELEPQAREQLQTMNLTAVTQPLLAARQIVAFLAHDNDKAVGVITLHQCAAIYAGGVFGEISELYVIPEYRSSKVGVRLVDTAKVYAKERKWQRLEVGTPPAQDSPRTLDFYKRMGFSATGQRMRCLIG